MLSPASVEKKSLNFGDVRLVVFSHVVGVFLVLSNPCSLGLTSCLALLRRSLMLPVFIPSVPFAVCLRTPSTSLTSSSVTSHLPPFPPGGLFIQLPPHGNTLVCLFSSSALHILRQRRRGVSSCLRIHPRTPRPVPGNARCGPALSSPRPAATTSGSLAGPRQPRRARLAQSEEQGTPVPGGRECQPHGECRDYSNLKT